MQRIFYVIFSLILLSPTVHPWYGLWLTPFLCFYFIKEVFIFTSMLPFAYNILERYFATGIWEENILITFLIYAPVSFLFIKNIYKFFRQDKN